jgi:hypothetical protein
MISKIVQGNFILKEVAEPLPIRKPLKRKGIRL